MDIYDRLFDAAKHEGDPEKASALRTAAMAGKLAFATDGPEVLTITYDPDDPDSLIETATELELMGERLRLLGEHLSDRSQ